MSRSLGHAEATFRDRGSSVRLEGGAHGAVGVVESGSGRAGRDAEGLGYLGRRVPEVVVHGEDGPLFGR